MCLVLPDIETAVKRELEAHLEAIPAGDNAHVAQMSSVLMIVVFAIDVICRTGSCEVRE